MRHSWRLGLCMLLLLYAPLGLAQSRSGPLTLVRMTPTGEDVPAGRQLVFEFSRPVVPLGRMERQAEEIPITITPPLACAWRWLNPTSLACQLGEQVAMSQATHYTVTVRPGLTTQDGATLAADVTHTFLTQRPKVLEARVKTWVTPGTPEMLVVFNQPMRRDTVARHLYIHTAPNKRAPLVVQEEKAYQGPDRGSGWLVRPATAVPPDTHLALRIEPGVVSTLGPEPGVEQRTLLELDTFPALLFLGVQCTTNADEPLIIPPTATRLPPQPRRCNVEQDIALRFSAPVRFEAVKDGLRVTPDLTGGRKDYDPWEEMPSLAGLAHHHRRGDVYEVALPSPLKAYTTYRLQVPPHKITDAFQRPLAEAVDMQFATDHRLPAFHLGHTVSVLEQQVETHVPLVVTNLESVRVEYDTLTVQGQQPRQERTMPFPKIQDAPYAFPLKIRDLIPASSGVIQGHLRTTPAVEEEPRWFFSQVTPFHVHVKAGHYNTLVWVTRFDTGLPVRDARVKYHVGALDMLHAHPHVLAEALTDADGIALLPGLSLLDEHLTLVEGNTEGVTPRLFLHLQHDADMALVPLVQQFQVLDYGTHPDSIDMALQRRHGHIRTWGTTPQGVYRVGDTVQYKLYVRDQDNTRFVPAPRAWYTLHILDPTGKVVHAVQDVSLSEFGAYDGHFTVPQNSAVGWYRFELSSTFSDEKWHPMRVLISDFTPAPFRVTTDLHGTLFTPGSAMTVTTQARLHAGGPYSTAPVRLTATVQGQPLVPADPQAAGFTFAVSEQAGQALAATDTAEPDAPDTEDDEVIRAEPTASDTLFETEDLLDDKGLLETSWTLASARVLYGQLRVESAVRDDRGKAVAGHATARYVGRDRYVGIRQADWLLAAGVPSQLQTLVVDAQGTAVAGTEVRVTVEHLQTQAAQVKSAGNAYVPRYVKTWREVATCTHVSATTPGVCSFTPQAPGTYRLRAQIVDTQGRLHRSTIRTWVTGAGDILWETTPGNALQVVPEKPTYKVGDTARYLVQNPFPGARALVTVERLGVQRSWLATFQDSTAVVELPITPDHVPGFYLSVMVMSPRVDKPLVEHVDLGKPAFRLGYVQTMVHDPYKELLVDIQPRQTVYKPRQTATVDLRVRTRQGDVPPLELAVAVLDEAVFDLIATGRSYFDPYKGFYILDALDVRNYNVIVQLIGRQKFDKKGANPGGDGGVDLNLRSVFQFVSYWNPSLRPDANGHATISFELPDNLTGWRVLAMAVTPDDRMGLGEGHFQANKPTEIRPALPNQVLAGDRFEASFTILNRTEATRTLDVTLSATGPLQATEGVQTRLEAEPFKRYTVRLPVQTTGAGTLTLRVQAGDTQDRDGLEMPLSVRRPQALAVAATSGTTTTDEVKEAIAFPPDIRTDVGHVSVTAAPTMLGGLEGSFTYMRDYPYACWEQKLTKGVMAAHYHNLTPYLPATLQWPESQTLPRTTLELAANYQAPNGGMTYYLPKDEYVSPDLSAYTALAFTWLRASGYPVPEPVEAKLHEYLLTFLRRDTGPDFYAPGMSATVRAVTLAALARHGKLTRDDLLRYQPHLQDMSLFGKAHYLLALTRVADTATVQAEVVNALRAHADETSGTLVFREEVDAAYQRLLHSSGRTQCAILSALVAYETAHKDAATASDLPVKLTRTITQARKQQNRWENTQENIFCTNALVDFSRAYEQVKPHFTLRAWFDTTLLGDAQFADYQDAAVDFQRPIQPDDAGRQATVTLARQGQGRLYYTTRLFYALAVVQAEPLNAGMEIHREYSVERGRGWLLLDSPMQIRPGELVRVDLYLSLPAARNFVVIDDPVPGGVEPVNRDLATASMVDAEKATTQYAPEAFWFTQRDWRGFGTSRWSFYHQELRHHAVRFYSEYLPAGRYHLSYVAQAIATGEFTVLPGRVEEMYNPETFGQSAPAILRVIRDEQHEAHR